MSIENGIKYVTFGEGKSYGDLVFALRLNEETACAELVYMHKDESISEARCMYAVKDCGSFFLNIDYMQDFAPVTAMVCKSEYPFHPDFWFEYETMKCTENTVRIGRKMMGSSENAVIFVQRDDTWYLLKAYEINKEGCPDGYSFGEEVPLYTTYGDT